MAKNNPYALSFKGYGYNSHISLENPIILPINDTWAIEYYYYAKGQRQMFGGDYEGGASALYHDSYSGGFRLIDDAEVGYTWENFDLTTHVWGRVKLVCENGTITLYQNNENLGSTTSISSDIIINAIGNTIEGNYQRTWNGYLDEIRIWDSDPKLEKDYTLESDFPGLLHYYRLDSGSGTTIIDSTGNNNGTLANCNWVLGEVGLETFNNPLLNITYSSDFTNFPPLITKPTEQEVNWSRYFGSDFIRYEVYRGTTPDVTNETGTLVFETTDVGVLKYVDKDLNAGTAYYYKVYAIQENDTYVNWVDISDGSPTKPVIDAWKQDDKIYYYAGDETWIYNEENTWTQLTLDNHPNDETNYLDTKISNGIAFSGSYDGTTPVQETWEFDETDGWQQLTPTTQPPARIGHGFAGDIVFGGFDGTNYLDDTWRFVDGDWVEIKTPGPSPRRDFGMTKGDDGVIYLYGGEADDETLLNDFWKFENGEWYKINNDKLPPIDNTVSFNTTLTEANESISYIHNDENYLYVGDRNGATRIYDVDDFSLIQSLDMTGNFSFADENYLYTISGYNVNVYDISNYDLVGSLTNPSNAILSICSDNSGYICVGSRDTFVYIYDYNNLSLIDTIEQPDLDYGNPVYIDETYIYIGGEDSIVDLYDKDDFSLKHSFDVPARARRVYVDDKYIYVGTLNNSVYVHDKKTLSRVGSLPSSKSSLKFVSDSNFIYLTTYSGSEFLVIDKNNFENYQNFSMTDRGNNISIGEKLIFTGSIDSKVYIYNKPVFGFKNISISSQSLIFFGGTDGTNYSENTYQYNLETNSFDELSFTNNPDPQAANKLIQHGRDLILIGGHNEVDLTDVWKLERAPVIGNPSNEQNSPTTPYGFARYKRRHGERQEHFDTYIDISHPDTNYIHDDKLELADGKRILMNLNIDHLKDNVTIDEAKLRLYLEDADGLITSDELIPQMTSNTEPEGVVSSSNDSDNVWHAFDYNSNTAWHSGEVPCWLGYEFSKKVIVKEYQIKVNNSATSPNRPQKWLFEGSDDGINWTILDERENETDWGYSEKRSYSINPDKQESFARYRLNFLSGSDSSISLKGVYLLGYNPNPRQFEIYPCTSHLYPTATWYAAPSREDNPIIVDVDWTAGNYIDISITDIIKRWNSKELNKNGILIKKADESNGETFTFSSMESNTNKPEFIINYLMQGVGFDSTETDYDFYTTPEGVELKPKNVTTILGGDYKIISVEIINSNSLPINDAILELIDVDSDDIVELSLNNNPFISEQTPFNIGTLQPREKKIIYIKISAGDNSNGYKNCKLKITGKVSN